jgi:para-nitrobenzyl esterase
MPSAKGLFHKAVVLSGATVKTGEKDYTEKLGEYILKEAGLKSADISKLQEMPWMDYYLLSNRAATKLAEESGPSTGIMRRGFNPCADGKVIPADPYFPEANPFAAEVPMLICSTMNEFAPSRTDAELEKITLDEVKAKLKERTFFGPGLGDKADGIVDGYAKVFPDRKPVEIWSMVLGNRQGVVALADAKSKQPAPVYVAWFCWQPPLFDNRMRAFHCIDICFWFANTDLMITHTGGGARPRKLSDKMSASLIRFMKTGDPNGGALPIWPKYTSGKGELMVLDDVSESKNDPDREARKDLPVT